jgi:hypothetical protein
MTAGERAAQVWAVLALAARNRQVLTYELVSQLVGVPARGLGQILERIQSYCLLNKRPPLTILVVQEGTGFPGSGFTAASAEDYGRKQMEVFAHDWLSGGPPTPEQLEQAAADLPSRPVRERGPHAV